MYVGKKPMNVIEYPVSNFVSKDPPRFYKTKKHWTVHTGDILRGQSDNTQLFDGSVLAVSRYENQGRYGRSSYTPKVNKEFRPPLVDPEYDLVPLCRIPRPRTQARINPDASHLAQTQNIAGIDVSSMIDERKMKGNVRPSFTINMELPQDERAMNYPDLKIKQPVVAGYTAVNTPMVVENDKREYELYNLNPSVYATSSVNTPVCFDQPSPYENLDLVFNQPNVNAMAGLNIPYEQSSVTSLEDLQLEYNCPQVGGKTGMNTPFTTTQDTPQQELQYNRPQTSMRSNPNMRIQLQQDQQQFIKTQNPIKLDYTTTKNYGVTKSTVNTNPLLRPTLQYNRSVQSDCVIPSQLMHQQPTLKQKR